MEDRTDAGLRAFLRGPLAVRHDIQLCRQDLAELEQRCRSITPQGDGVPGGSGDPHKDGTMIALADKSCELDRLIRDELPRKERAVGCFLQMIPDDRYRAILHLRYVNGLPWQKVQERMAAMQMPYAERYLYGMHGRALDAAREIWKEVVSDGEDA